MEIDRELLRRLRDRVNEALAPVGKELGVVLTVGSASFSPNSATMKLNVATIASDGTVVDRAAELFKRDAKYYGLKPEDLGRTFNRFGKSLTICGLSPKSRKYPITVKDATGHRFKMQAIEVQSFLKQNK